MPFRRTIGNVMKEIFITFFLCEFYSVLHSIKTKWELKMSGFIKAKKEMVGNIGK